MQWRSALFSFTSRAPFTTDPKYFVRCSLCFYCIFIDFIPKKASHIWPFLPTGTAICIEKLMKITCACVSRHLDRWDRTPHFCEFRSPLFSVLHCCAEIRVKLISGLHHFDRYLIRNIVILLCGRCQIVMERHRTKMAVAKRIGRLTRQPMLAILLLCALAYIRFI